METKTEKHLPNKVRRRKARREARQARKTSGEARAVAKYVKTGPRKLRIIMDNIRGKSAEEALNILRFTPRRAARILAKVVESAIANAENNLQLDSENLYIHRAYVDGGPTVRRFRAASMGRATPIRRRTSHITIVVKEKGDES